MASQGWVCVYRDIFENWIWSDNEAFDKRSAWIDLLLLVNHEDKKIYFDGKLQLVKRGQKITSLTQLAERWHWSRNKVKRFLELLESDGMILLEIETRKKTVVTVVNYSKYQDVKNKNGPETDHRRTTDGPQADINNNDNNDNNDNKMMIQNFLEKFKELTNKKISSSTEKKLKNYDVIILNKILEEIEKSDYLKENASASWIFNNANKVLEGKYRNFKKKEETQTKFHNFKQLSENYDEDYLENIAREKRKKLLKELYEE